MANTKLKDFAYTGKFDEGATCGLTRPFKEGYAVGCGTRYCL